MNCLNIFLFFLFVLTSCHSFNPKILEDLKYAGGRDYETGKPIKPTAYYFQDYTLVTGFDTSGNATLGLYLGSKEIYTSTFQDGGYDTIVKVNLNNDAVPDFLVSYAFEDGADLGAIISQSKFTFNEKLIARDYQAVYCNGDMSSVVEFPLVEDLNYDGKGEVVIRWALKEGKPASTPCTDTIFLGM